MTELLADVIAEQSEAPETTEQSEGTTEAETETEETADDAAKSDEDKGDDADGKDDSEDEQKPKKRLSGSERLKRRLAAAEAELQAVRSRVGSDGEPSTADVERLVGKAPKEEDFNGDFLKFERALTVYELRKAQAEDRIREHTQSTKTAAETRRREMAEAHQDRVAEFREKAKDFDATLKAASNLKASPAVEELVLESDKSAHLVYYLAKHPERLETLNEMSEREAAREIGRIEARLSLPAPKTQTTAPKPVIPPKGGATPSSPDRDLEAWLKKTYG